MATAYRFSLGEKVSVMGGAESGIVVGRSEHVNASHQYLVRYVDGTGCAVERWWSDDAIEAVKAS